MRFHKVVTTLAVGVILSMTVPTTATAAEQQIVGSPAGALSVDADLSAPEIQAQVGQLEEFAGQIADASSRSEGNRGRPAGFVCWAQ